MSDQLTAVVAASMGDLGFDLEALELTPAGKHRVLRIAIDRDGGVGIDDLTAATRTLSAALDASDVMGSLPYTLEVTSRGVDSPLTQPRHWRRNVGRLVQAQMAAGHTIEGRIGVSDETGVDLDTVDGTRHIRYDDVATALVQIELNRKDR